MPWKEKGLPLPFLVWGRGREGEKRAQHSAYAQRYPVLVLLTPIPGYPTPRPDLPAVVPARQARTKTRPSLARWGKRRKSPSARWFSFGAGVAPGAASSAAGTPLSAKRSLLGGKLFEEPPRSQGAPGPSEAGKKERFPPELRKKQTEGEHRAPTGRGREPHRREGGASWPAGRFKSP